MSRPFVAGRGGVSRLSLHRVAHARRGAVAYWRRGARGRVARGAERLRAATCAAGAIGAVCATTAAGVTAARCGLLHMPASPRRRPCPARSHLRQAAAAGRLDVSADRGRHAAVLDGAGARTRHRTGEARVVAEPVDRRRGAADRLERGDPPRPRANRTGSGDRFHRAHRRSKRSSSRTPVLLSFSRGPASG